MMSAAPATASASTCDGMDEDAMTRVGSATTSAAPIAVK
jgi:hypothetical protein